MRSPKRAFILLITSLLSFVALTGLIFFYPPYTTISLSIPFSLDRLVQSAPLGLFFLLVFVFFFSLGSSVFKSKKHGVLLAGLVISYLIFRLIHLTHPFFLILLLALFFVLELFVSTRENTK